MCSWISRRRPDQARTWVLAGRGCRGLFVSLSVMCLCGGDLNSQPGDIGPVKVFTGMCDASAAVHAGGDAFWVANDEENTLRLYAPEHGSQPIDRLPLDTFLRVDSKHPEADIEGAAAVGDWVYWITSHGRNKNGKQRPSRRRFFATRWVEPGGRNRFRRLIPVGQPCQELLGALLADSRLREFQLDEAAWRAPKDRGGLNIEGLAAAPDGALWIGFRNPIPGGRALVVPLINPQAVVLQGAWPRLGDPFQLDLDGLGVRDMVRDGNAWWILAGRPDQGGRFRLYQWAGPGTVPQPRPLKLPADFSPEALVPTTPGHGWLLSDDGSLQIDGCPCKELKDPMQRRFRALAWRPGS